MESQDPWWVREDEKPREEEVGWNLSAVLGIDSILAFSINLCLTWAVINIVNNTVLYSSDWTVTVARGFGILNPGMIRTGQEVVAIRLGTFGLLLYLALPISIGIPHRYSL